MGNKLCTHCGKTQPLTAYYKNRTKPDGVQAWCKPCHNISTYPGTTRWRAKNPDKVRVMRQRYASTYWIKRPGLKYQYYRGWLTRNPLKRRAHRAIERALATGLLVRPAHCHRCLKPGKIEAHHPDYCELLKVEWVCGPCHDQVHRHTPKESL